MKGKKWSKAEKDLIIKEVSAHPENLSKCFTVLSIRLNRTKRAITQMYYKMNDPKDKHYIGSSKTRFLLIGKKSFYNNKVYREGCKNRPIKTKKTILTKVINLIKTIIK